MVTNSTESFHQGERLHAYIKNKNFSVRGVAEHLEMPVTTFYEQFKKSELLRSLVEKVMRLIDTSAEDFYKYDLPPHEKSKAPETDIAKLLRIVKAQDKKMDEILKLLKGKKIRT